MVIEERDVSWHLIGKLVMRESERERFCKDESERKGNKIPTEGK